MKNLYMMAFAALAMFTFGCSSDSDGGTPATGNCNSDIPFFQTGKFEKFKFTQLGTDMGTMKLSFGDCDGTGLVSSMEFRNTSNVVTQTIPMKFYQEGVFLISDPNNNGAPFLKQYKKDAQLNDTWTETSENGATIIHTVVDVDSLITVPAGSFHCKVYHYEKSDIINDSYIFWNDEYGQIMEDAGFMKLELMEHN